MAVTSKLFQPEPRRGSVDYIGFLDAFKRMAGGENNAKEAV